MPLTPAALYGLEIPPGDIIVPVTQSSRVSINITMAAIDPSEEIEDDGQAPRRPRSTLKLIKEVIDESLIGDDDEEGESDDEDEYLRNLLMAAEGSDEDDSDDDDEPNGGPSDPTKSKKAAREAALKELLDATKDEDSDEEMADEEPKKTKKTNGAKAKGKANGKGKGKASEDDDEESDEESDDESENDELSQLNLEHFVVCTLDTESHYQQPLQLTINEGEKAFFVNSGTHTIYVTGNYVMQEDDASETDEDDDDDEDYDLPPELDDLVGDASSEEDELDNIGRIEEIDTDDEEAPKLVDTKKGGKKRPAEEEADGLDDLMAKDKQSKKQAKKVKANDGKAVPAEKETPKSEKKVQFAKNLEQGPTGSPMEKPKQEAKKAPSVRVEKGVTIDDRKVGTGRTAKPGDKVGMRYIGKLASNGKVFDSNKKGPPFSFKLGKGEVIEGWDIGVKGMAVGGERRLTIPASKAYGKQSMPGIPANSTLIFDIKMLEIK